MIPFIIGVIYVLYQTPPDPFFYGLLCGPHISSSILLSTLLFQLLNGLFNDSVRSDVVQ